MGSKCSAAGRRLETVVSICIETVGDSSQYLYRDSCVKPEGQAFIRTICMALDEFVWTKNSGEKMFSQSV